MVTDGPGYSDWNPFMFLVEGTIAAGTRLKVHMRLGDGKPMVFTPVVTRMTHGESFRWKGGLILPLLFDGEHVFEIEPQGDGMARFVQRESFRGLLVPVLRKMLDTRTKAAFELMNRALKEAAENK
jgi:hypothetical protein